MFTRGWGLGRSACPLGDTTDLLVSPLYSTSCVDRASQTAGRDWGRRMCIKEYFWLLCSITVLGDDDAYVTRTMNVKTATIIEAAGS